MAVPHFLRTFNVPLFVPLPNFIRGHFVNFSTRRNKSLNIGHLSFAVKMARFFQVFLCQYYVYKLTIWNVIDIISQSSISCSHCGRLSPSCNSILLAFIFILLFSRAVAIAISPLLFSLLGLPYHSSLLSTILILGRHFYSHAIFIAAVHFIAVQPAIIVAFHSRLDLSFVELPFLLWSCRRHIHFAAKDVFIVTTNCRPILFLLFWLFFS